MMVQLIASVALILTYLGLISVGCLIGGVYALFDGSPLWFALMGIAIGVVGLFCTHYHLTLALAAYRNFKRLQPAARPTAPATGETE